mmetsp:Transcript_96455/g.251428  ORF Transcript_96455/g.251428 Transcript_96455/m.251428 type:complete len:218 (-) Transcript_96455:587-1240(-)
MTSCGSRHAERVDADLGLLHGQEGRLRRALEVDLGPSGPLGCEAVVPAAHLQAGVVLPLPAVLPERGGPLALLADGDRGAALARLLQDLVEQTNLERVVSVIKLEATCGRGCEEHIVWAPVHVLVAWVILQSCSPFDIRLARPGALPGARFLLAEAGVLLSTAVCAFDETKPFIFASAAVADPVVHGPEPDHLAWAQRCPRALCGPPPAREAGQRAR